MEERVSVHTYVLLLFSVGQEQVEWWIHCLCVSKKEKRECGGLFLMRREFGADKEAKLLECQQEGSMYVCMCVHACVCASNYISFYSLKKKIPWRQCTDHQQQCQRCPSMRCHSYIHKDIVITVCTEKHTWTPHTQPHHSSWYPVLELRWAV